MPTDANGNFSLVAGYLAEDGQTIQPSQHNPPLEDIASALTGRLPRNGSAPMTAPLKISDGSESQPAFAYASQPSTGEYKTTDGIGWSINGSLVMELKSTGIEILGTAQFAQIVDKAVTLRKLYHPTSTKVVLGRSASTAQAITGAANNGSGLVRLTVSSTSGYSTGKVETVSDVLGTTEANGTWTITVVDGTHIDLQGSTFANTWLSGGTIGGGFKEIALSELLDFIGSAAQGDILYRDVSGWGRLPASVAGYLLQSGGASGNPSWTAPTGGNLSSQTASSSAALTFTNLDGTYREYVFDIDSLLPATDNVQLIMEVSVDGGSTWKTSGYIGGAWGFISGGGSANGMITTAFSLSRSVVGNTSFNGWSGQVSVLNPGASVSNKVFRCSGGFMVSGGAVFELANGAGTYNGGTGPVNAVRFRYSSGNIALGTITQSGKRG